MSTQFFTRIYYEIPKAYIATFCTLKYLLGKNSKEFRDIFNAKLGKSFIVPSYTFDNVGGNFPYGIIIAMLLIVLVTILLLKKLLLKYQIPHIVLYQVK